MNTAATPHTLRRQFQQNKHALLASSAHTPPHKLAVAHTLRQLTQWVDTLLRQLWQIHQLHNQAVALVAIGGYGRKALFPYSDVDVLILHDAPISNTIQERIAAFVRSCWDMGLDMGSHVSTVALCLNSTQTDIHLQTALLDRRFLSGKRRIYTQLGHAFTQHLNARTFYAAKMQELQQRHAHFDNTAYALEPNVKESPGGLRDWHTVRWVAQAAGFNPSWGGLLAHGLITPLEQQQLRKHYRYLQRMRLLLHLHAHRGEERLLFDMQNQLAQPTAQNQAPTNRNTLRPSERLMRRYYLSAKTIHQLSRIVLHTIHERLNPTPNHTTPIDKHFNQQQHVLDIARSTLYQTTPHAILHTFIVWQQHDALQGLSTATWRALYNARSSVHKPFRTNPRHQQQFLHIVQAAPQTVPDALELMHQSGILGRYIVPFGRIEGQLQHDLFHIYTVDQHILKVVRYLSHFFMPEHVHEYPLCSRLAANWQQPWLLFVAALFHDVGKGKGGDHSILGAKAIQRFARQHHINKADTQLLVFLVREHLSMSQVAQKQDLSDPTVISQFAQKVGNVRYLTALYLLTIADIRGTSPKVWSAWKAKLLQDLYIATVNALGGHIAKQPELVQARCSGALIALAQRGFHQTSAQHYVQFWSTLDAAYFVRHDTSAIAWHAQHIVPQSQAATIVRTRTAQHGEGLDVVVYTPDKPELFARICAYFAQAQYNIVDAKIHTSSTCQALDSFHIVAAPHQAATPLAKQQTSIENALHHALHTQAKLPKPSSMRLSPRARSFPVQPLVQLKPNDNHTHWLLSIHANDQIGLLYRIATVLAQHNIDIQLAKIATMGERAEDSFLIQAKHLAQAAARTALQQDLMRVLQQQ